MPAGRILIVEDRDSLRRMLERALTQEGYEVTTAADGPEGIRRVREQPFDLVLTDLKLPDASGLEVLAASRDAQPRVPVVVLTGYGTVGTAVEAMKLGAFDFLEKPVELDDLARLIERAIGDAGEAEKATFQAPGAPAIVGRHPRLRAAVRLLEKVAPTESTVLLTGESGTGKELFARALHTLGPRAAGPFVAINCATLSEPILESELFGHDKGAFTSADRAKPGVLELADQGTLFLDEVNEMGLGVQAKLLRFIERREFRRVGGTRKISVDLNVVAATNASLEECVAGGRFREDLYYRLKVVTIHVPPLRERREAIPILAESFLAAIAKHTGLPAKRLTPEALQLLERHDWPGNIRELRNCMESLMLMVPRPVLDVEDLPPVMRGAASTEIRLSVGMRMDDVEREVIRRNLEAYPTLKDTARALGIGLRTLHEKLQRYGLRRAGAAAVRDPQRREP